jgi:DNA-binding GntR family transcriptional regulator
MAKREIDFSDREHVYRQLAGFIRDDIESGKIPARHAIPSSRDLRERYGVGKGTVVRATDLLKAEGLIEFVKGRGFFVTER